MNIGKPVKDNQSWELKNI